MYKRSICTFFISVRWIKIKQEVFFIGFYTSIICIFTWQGPVASVSIGEVRLSLRQSLLNLGFGFAYRDSKLQILISDIEVVMRHSGKIAQKAKVQKSRTSGRGKWMVLANMARFLTISVTDLVVKV